MEDFYFSDADTLVNTVTVLQNLTTLWTSMLVLSFEPLWCVKTSADGLKTWFKKKPLPLQKRSVERFQTQSSVLGLTPESAPTAKEREFRVVNECLKELNSYLIQSNICSVKPWSVHVYPWEVWFVYFKIYNYPLLEWSCKKIFDALIYVFKGCVVMLLGKSFNCNSSVAVRSYHPQHYLKNSWLIK